MLLLAGILAGPVAGVLDPDRLFGDLLFPVVSASVAVILFEGGLSLRLSELKQIGRVVRNLTTIGILVTWVLSSAAALLILRLDLSLAVLLGAILVVTGPTVILPLLRHIRPSGRIAPIMKWEGIVNDPIGVLLGVLVFEGIFASRIGEATSAVFGIARAAAIGTLAGALGALVLSRVFKRYWVPDFLQNPFSLVTVIAVFAVSNHLQTESGLVAVTIMGIVLANQQSVVIRHIVEFKENLRILLLSVLFVVLAARLPASSLEQAGWPSLLFLAALVVVVRPLAVYVSTLGSDLEWREKLFLAWMAPRGIVAAAVSSLFALRLVEAGQADAARLAPVTFVVIVGTAALYGLSASPLARALGLARRDPEGLLIIGADAWVRELASLIREEKFELALVDFNRRNVAAARLAGLRAYYANVLSEPTLEKIDLSGLGRVLALTSNDEVNALAALHYAGDFGRSSVYQLPPESDGGENEWAAISPHLRGRLLFHPRASYAHLADRFRAGAVLKKSRLTERFDYDAFQAHYRGSAMPLFWIKDRAQLVVCTAETEIAPRPGDTLISLVDEVSKPGESGESAPTSQPVTA